ncbi:MAG: translation initiation factor IF-3 [bacterium]
MRRIHRKPKPSKEKKFRANQQIKVPQVFLIDADGVNVGPTDTDKAVEIAKEADLDLVEVNPKASPPIAKIMDYGQFKYENDKKIQKQKVKNRKSDTKDIRLSVRIGSHDFNFKLEQAKKFLLKGSKLKIELRLKGRERQHPNIGRDVVNKFIEELKKVEEMQVEIEEALTKQGGKFNILLANKGKITKLKQN